MTGAFSFDFSCLDQMSRDLQKIGADVNKNEKAAVKLAGNAYMTDVQERLQYKTGTLRRSPHVEQSEENGHPIVLVGTNLIYAKQREFGGIIRAKNAPFLKFKTEDGTWVQTKQVYQPAHPVWRPVLDNNREKYRNMMLATLAGKSYAEPVANPAPTTPSRSSSSSENDFMGPVTVQKGTPSKPGVRYVGDWD